MAPIINVVGKKSIGYNQVAVIDVITSNISSHDFVMEETMKEVSLEEMFQTMCKNDFNESSNIKLNSRVMQDAEEVSSEDRHFFQMVEEKTTKAGEHCVVPLLLWNKGLEMSNYRRQVMKRLIYLKARFKRNPSYFADYKKFMDDLKEGYKTDTRPPGKTWFIPHQWVYHPSKPGKIRVVFDCRAEFDEQSLNKELLTGPDLTNQIVGVLTRFWQNSIAFMAGIYRLYTVR